ncbi:hypothetical protein OROGR_008309 [Orobanche gracilis]
MNTIILAFIIMFIISILLADGAFPPASFGIKKEIFLLAGQSNMAGIGGVVGQKWDKFVPPECSADPRILQLTKNLTWEEAHDPLHKDIDNGKPCGVGPGMPFSNMLLRASGVMTHHISSFWVAVTSRAGRYVDIVRKAQLEMDLPNIFCIDVDGLEVNRNDELHLTTSAQVQLGRMFADVILYCTMNFNKDFCAPYMTTK